MDKHKAYIMTKDGYKMAQLYFSYGTMSSGKSIEVLKVVHNYEEQGKRALLYTPAIDTRSGVDRVTSRVEGMSREATVVETRSNIFGMVQDENVKESVMCLVIDEAQFLSREQVIQCARVVDDLGIPVMTFGLKNDYENKLFEGSQALVEIADKLKEIKTICWYCNKKATMNLRTNRRMTEQIEIGGSSDYKPVCRKHYRDMHEEE